MKLVLRHVSATPAAAPAKNAQYTFTDQVADGALDRSALDASIFSNALE